jgi:hypothetical protein
MIRFIVFLLRCGLSRRDMDVCLGNVGKFMCFFPNIRWACVAMNLNAQSWDCAFVEKVKLEKSFVVLFLRHIVLRLPEGVVAKYHVASTNIHGCMTAHLHD